jgi:hypothetical protein
MPCRQLWTGNMVSVESYRSLSSGSHALIPNLRHWYLSAPYCIHHVTENSTTQVQRPNRLRLCMSLIGLAEILSKLHSNIAWSPLPSVDQRAPGIPWSSILLFRVPYKVPHVSSCFVSRSSLNSKTPELAFCWCPKLVMMCCTYAHGPPWYSRNVCIWHSGSCVWCRARAQWAAASQPLVWHHRIQTLSVSTSSKVKSLNLWNSVKLNTWGKRARPGCCRRRGRTAWAHSPHITTQGCSHVRRTRPFRLHGSWLSGAGPLQ